MPNFEKAKEDEKSYVIFTDLDGTLLDENYSYKKAASVLESLRKKNVPIIFCSAKTKAEQEVIRKKMKINHPFIVENGSAIYIPKDYFKKRVGELNGKYEMVVLGVNAEKIKKEINRLRKRYKIKSKSNMTDKEVMKVSGLDLKSARLAKMREFGDTVVEADKEALKELKKKFNVVSGGRFIQVFGKNVSKGKAVERLIKIYKDFGGVKTVGVGNAKNDKEMLEVVDIPTIVKNPGGNWADLKIRGIYKANGIGPEGWVEVVKKFVLNK